MVGLRGWRLWWNWQQFAGQKGEVLRKAQVVRRLGDSDEEHLLRDRMAVRLWKGAFDFGHGMMDLMSSAAAYETWGTGNLLRG